MRGILPVSALVAVSLVHSSAAMSAEKVDCAKTPKHAECSEASPAPTSKAKANTPRASGLQVIDQVPSPPNVLFDKDDQTGGRASQRLNDPPSGKRDDPQQREEITVRKSGDETITEYRSRGRLYKQKVQLGNGGAYFLVDEKGDGKFVRYDGPEQRISVPTWVLLTW